MRRSLALSCNLSVFPVCGRIVIRRHLRGKPRLTLQFLLGNNKILQGRYVHEDVMFLITWVRYDRK